MLLLKVSYCIIDVLYILTPYVCLQNIYKIYYFDTQIVDQ